jgi:enoyl-[acyl-carrier protein] reductase II
MLRSWLTETVGIRHPIIQGGMGPYSTNRLCAATANAGGLGIVSLLGMAVQHSEATPVDPTPVFGEGTTEDHVRRSLEYVERETRTSGGIFGVNCPVSAEFADAAARLIEAVLAARDARADLQRRLRVIITSAGDPVPWAPPIRRADLLWFHVVPSVDHARRAERAGVDAIVASGHEGGGHVSWQPVHSMVLVPAVVEVTAVPVIAAGGICDGRTLAAAFALGAVGVQMGTRFIATLECDFWDAWKEGVLRSSDRGTAVARGMFGPLRFLQNAFGRRLVAKTIEQVPEFFTGEPVALSRELLELEREGFAALAANDLDGGLMLAGEVAGRIDDLPTVRELIERIVADAERILCQLPHALVRDDADRQARGGA